MGSDRCNMFEREEMLHRRIKELERRKDHLFLRISGRARLNKNTGNKTREEAYETCLLDIVDIFNAEFTDNQ